MLAKRKMNMSKISIKESVENLPDEQRVAVKTRATSIKQAIYDLDPSFVCQPWDDILNSVCLTAAWDDYENANTSDSETLILAREMFDGLADREDVRAIMSETDDGTIESRKLEEKYRTLSKLTDQLIENKNQLAPGAIVSSLLKI